MSQTPPDTTLAPPPAAETLQIADNLTSPVAEINPAPVEEIATPPASEPENVVVEAQASEAETEEVEAKNVEAETEEVEAEPEEVAAESEAVEVEAAEAEVEAVEAETETEAVEAEPEAIAEAAAVQPASIESSPAVLAAAEATAAVFPAPAAAVPAAPLPAAPLPATPRVAPVVAAPIAQYEPEPRVWPRRVAIGVGVLLVVVGGGLLGTYAAWKSSAQIAPGLLIEGEPVGGLTAREARQRLEERFGELALKVQTPVKDYELPLSEWGGAPDFNRAVNNAYFYARSGPILPAAMRFFQARFDERNLDLHVNWDKEQLKTSMRAVAAEVDAPPQDARLEVTSEGSTVVPEEAGRRLNVGATLGRLQRTYDFGVKTLDATIEEKEPRLRAADLAGTDVKLGEYTTTFNAGLRGRTANIQVAARAIEACVMMPGETFSFNSKTGERTYDKGYRMAHIFLRMPGESESQVVDGLAGGICQVSSTLFNAVRKSNGKMGGGLQIVQRETHSLPVPYVPRGFDATVAWPNRDFKFRNTLTHPIYLRTAIKGSRLTISVWGRVPETLAAQLQEKQAATGGNKPAG